MIHVDCTPKKVENYRQKWSQKVVVDPSKTTSSINSQKTSIENLLIKYQ